MPYRSVIFIDDDPSIRTLAERTTRHLDCEFLFYERMLDVCDQIEVIKPKLVVIDMSMTNMDDEYDENAGLNVSQYLRQKFGNTFPILVLTGHESASLISKCLYSGADDYFVKSHEFSGLMRRIASWLVMDYSKDGGEKRREVAARALDKLVAEHGLLTVKEWRKVALRTLGPRDAAALPLN